MNIFRLLTVELFISSGSK